jgi:hypothetical protein
MREIKSAKLAFYHVARKRDILGHTDAAQLLLRSTDAVMITADVLTAHFGKHQQSNTAQLQRRSSNAVTELVLCCSVY